MYFSGGLTRNGIENQASLRMATNAAVKANMAIYAVDTRGLEALPPVGNASTGSLRGTAAYSGQAMQNQLNSNFASQETLATLSSDTGGKAFFDSNDFGPAFQQVQHDTEAYYILGFRSTNLAKDGSFRHLTIKLNRNDVKLDYRPGYYAQADFQHAKTQDRELQLTEQLQSDLPATEVAVYLQALYFRLDEGKFFVPISLIVPGSQIPFVKNGDRDKATLDVIGQVKNAQQIIVGNIRDTVKLAVDQGQEVEAEEHPVFDRVHAGSGSVSPEVRGAGEPDGTDGQLRDGSAGSGYAEGDDEAQLDRDVEPADAEYGEARGESSGAGWGGVDSEYPACIPAGSAFVFPVRGI